jgi:hypothetical protein
MADGMNTDVPRSREQRRRDTLSRLENDVDLWVATAGKDGTPHLVPLSFLWDGADLIISTTSSGPTGINLLAGGTVRLGLGATRDVIMIDATVRVFEPSGELADEFAAKAGFEPRDDKDMLYFRLTPRRIQAWREVNELKDRTLMRDGEWL